MSLFSTKCMLSTIFILLACQVYSQIIEEESQKCAEGMVQDCNAQICCCYNDQIGFVKYKAEGDECKAIFDADVGITVVLFVVSIVPIIVGSLYFSGKCCLHPYKFDPIYFSRREVEMASVQRRQF